jgi:hypothetical protein
MDGGCSFKIIFDHGQQAADCVTSLSNRAACVHTNVGSTTCMIYRTFRLRESSRYSSISLHLIETRLSSWLRMSFQVIPAVEEDISRLTEIQFAAFGDDPTHQLLYPGDRYSKVVRANASRRVLKSWRQMPEMHIVKSVERGTGLITGFAKWILYETPRAEDEWNVKPNAPWAEGTHRVVVEQLLATTANIRGRRWEGKPYARESHTSRTDSDVII